MDWRRLSAPRWGAIKLRIDRTERVPVGNWGANAMDFARTTGSQFTCKTAACWMARAHPNQSSTMRYLRIESR
jgi:hypothetical protein